MCALRQSLLAAGLLAALFAPAAQAQQRLHFGQPPGGHGGAPPPFGQAPQAPQQFDHSGFPQQEQHPNDDDYGPSMSESVRRAQQLSGGRVIGTERVQSDGRAINRVKVIDGDGRVRYIDDNRRMPGRSGDARQYPYSQNFPLTP